MFFSFVCFFVLREYKREIVSMKEEERDSLGLGLIFNLSLYLFHTHSLSPLKSMINTKVQ